MTLHPSFLATPLAHRGYHDKTAGRPENSIAAAQAAIDAGYGIECDVQLSTDGVAMVFHDYDLFRLTPEKGVISRRTSQELQAIPLRHGTEGIPTLRQFLDCVAGRVPLLIEIKDQDGQMGPNVGALESAVVADLAGYTGPVAVMSFNPHSVARMAELAPDVPRGITTAAYGASGWEYLPLALRQTLRAIPDFDRTGSSFISHEAADLGRKRVAEIKATGAAILCWTIRSAEAEAKARNIADNITFEGYPA
jgi:glycerophosphoryl diester phosphodiesterase